jgi:hypothetical protein
MGILFTTFGTLGEIVVEGNSQLALSSFDGPMNKRCQASTFSLYGALPHCTVFFGSHVIAPLGFRILTYF